MHLQEIFDQRGQSYMKHCPLHHMTYVSAKVEVAKAKGLKMYI